jgi:hypothetical protein
MAKKKDIEFQSTSLDHIDDDKLSEIMEKVITSKKGVSALKSMMRSVMRSALRSAVRSSVKSPMKSPPRATKGGADKKE